MANRSAYGLYNTITLGVAGTPMTAFKQLSEDERWALAFYVANLGVPQDHRDRGKALWQGGDAARNAFPDLANVATLSPNEVAARHGEKAARMQDYLRARPEALEKAKASSLAFARDTLSASLEAYRKGDPAHAQQLAVTAYLEGYELVEPALDAVDRDLRVAIENDMLGLRNLMRSGAPVAEVQLHVARVSDALQRAEDKLSGSSLSPAGATVSSFVIVLREGLEAILVLAALIAFLVKAGRRDALRYIHAGWISALLLGLVTWYLASYAVSMSGASREMTEGVTALVSSAILLYVGYWLHDKSHAQAWNRFIKD
jgi:high-affinity iron transporter